MTLTLNYQNLLSTRVGEHGISPEDFDCSQTQRAELTTKLNQSKGKNWERWRLLPFTPLRKEHTEAVHALVQKHQDKENIVVLGIGGSALGNIALQQALNPIHWNLMPRDARNNHPRIFILDNIDPLLVGHTFAEIRRTDPDLKRTLINVVSKSGETAETAAQFLIARAFLQETLGDNYAKNIVAVTDPQQGTMRQICDAENIATLPVPEGVGGRFSVLSPVGLFSAAMCGIDIEALLDGAAAMDTACSEDTTGGSGNSGGDAATLAWLLMELTARGKHNHILMPYSNRLYSLADWFRQLWAESLGKQHDLHGKEIFAGPTPLKALGTTDQHSQVQLYREGPHDKVVGFIEIEKFADDVTLPATIEVEALNYLQGATLSQLLSAEKRATEYALVESKRPNFTLSLPTLDAFHIGQFIQLWELITAYSGLILNIDAYNQPAVETGKVATFGLMGRKGYEEWKTKVDQTLSCPEPAVGSTA